MNTDELTGVQALERKYPGLPMAPGNVERIEFEYIRHGTCSFIISRDVVLAFIEYYNRTMAKPFKWTYQRKPLTI
jgi:hypothetical protein